MYRVTNPATGQVEKEYPTATDAQVQEALDASAAAFTEWHSRPLAERCAIVKKAAGIFEARADELGAIITREMGKRAEEAAGEAAFAGAIFGYYADNGPEFLQDLPLPGSDGQAVVQKRAIGPLLGVMPWNYPYYQVARFAGPNLVLGNTILIKHASQCPESGQVIEDIFTEAGLPHGAYQNLYATNDQVAAMIADPRLRGVSLTGSERAGAIIAQEAGESLKKAVLELGGSDPCVVLSSNDLDTTVSELLVSRMENTGQACNAPKRMIVHTDIYDDFVSLMQQKIEALTVGDPSDPGTDVGPLSSEAAVTTLIKQIDTARAQGATILTGGERLDRPGAWMSPCLLTGVKPSMDAYHEELFGPVVTVYRVSDDDEAVRLANDTPFGLGSRIFASDVDRARAVGEQIDAGMVIINSTEGEAENLPFGGVKRSGYGRELGPLGIEEFMNKRLMYVANS